MEFGEELQELGLTKNEGKVYSTLIEFGALTASEISAKSGAPYSRIYDILESLVRKTLVVVVPEKTKKYGPSNPDAFIELLNKKEKILNEAREKVKKMKQFYEIKEKQPVMIAHGDKGFHKIIKEMIKTKNYSYTIKWNADFKPEWVRSAEKDLKAKIDLKTLTRYNSESKKNVDQWLTINKDIRKIENEGIAFSVIDDKEVMIALIKSDSTLLIRDKAFAKIMKKMFLATYKEAEPIK